MALDASEIPTAPELFRLQEVREREVAKINKSYLKQLNILQAKFMKKGDLDRANQVNLEIKKFSPNPKIEAKVETTKWIWGSGGELIILADGFATHSKWSQNGTWKKLSDGSLRLSGGNGLMFKITFSPDGVGQVVNLRGDGKTTITRKK